MATEKESPLPAISQLINLGGKAGVVTGAAAGIGAAIARRLAEAGADLLLIDKDERALETTKSALKRWGTRVENAVLDVADSGLLTQASATAIKLFGRIDIWVNNAGVAPRAKTLEITPEDWNHVMDTNLRSAFVGAQCAARAMLNGERGGVIINVASSTAFRVSANPLHYRVSKAGLIALTQSLAVEYGRSGIRVLAVAPTLTDTPAVQSLKESGLDDGLREFVRRLPLKRIAIPDEVARVVLFAVSDLAAYMTGSALLVDGGEVQK